MRKIFTIICSALLLASYAQVNNVSFENWETRTYTLDPADIDPTIGLFVQSETYNYQAPIGWTPSNQLGKADLLYGADNVTRSDVSVADGDSSARLETVLAEISVTTPFGAFDFDFDLPGFIVSGDFELSPALFADIFLEEDVEQLDFSAIPGTGDAISERPEHLAGYIDYQPVGNDSAWIYSVLVRNDGSGREIVAIAEHVQKTNTGGMLFITADYNYVSCEMPDTAVTLISSSYIDISGNNQYTGEVGTVLYADSFELFFPSTPLELVPVLEDDVATLIVNTSVVIDVLANDVVCDGAESSMVIFPDVANGTTEILADFSVEYTPNEDYIGEDEFTYVICNNVGCDTAEVQITVNPIPPCVASDLTITLNSGASQNIVPVTVDCDNSTLAISTQPSNGTASVVNEELVYESNEDFSGSDSFQYTVCSDLDPDDCDTATVFITVVLSLNEIDANLISIYPNPVESTLNIALDLNESASVSLINTNGQVVLFDTFTFTTNLNVANLSNGVYFLRIQTENGVAHHKIQVSK